jgi:hypothetical protein
MHHLVKKYFLVILSVAWMRGMLGAEKNDSSSFTLSFNTEAQLFHQGYKYQEINADHVSDIKGNWVSPPSRWLTDNPLFHGAFYALFNTRATAYEKYSLDLDLLMEHRGMSYGFYDMDNVVFFPYFMFSLHDNYKILNEIFTVKLQTGSFREGKVHEGLKIYNLDYHGAKFKFSWRDVFFTYNHIGDLAHGDGLRLEELYDFATGIKLLDRPNNMVEWGVFYAMNNYDANEIDYWLFTPLNLKQNKMGAYHYSNYGTWGKYSCHDNFTLYFQLGIRETPYINLLENSAFLFGSEYQIEYQKFQLKINPEFRYYGWMYNYTHKDNSISYRKNPTDTANYYSNTKGRYLYPLANYNNNFSRWAVYTDYQYQNIAGAELRINMNMPLFNSFFLELEGESCTLIKEYEYGGNNTFTYLFYSADLQYMPIKNFKLGIGLGNKAMNLDKHYHSFYMLKKPVMHFYIRKEFDNKKN